MKKKTFLKGLYTTRHLWYGGSGPNKSSIHNGRSLRKEPKILNLFWRDLRGGSSPVQPDPRLSVSWRPIPTWPCQIKNNVRRWHFLSSSGKSSLHDLRTSVFECWTWLTMHLLCAVAEKLTVLTISKIWCRASCSDGRAPDSHDSYKGHCKGTACE